MGVISDATLLRVFVGEEDCHAARPQFKAIVARARAMELAGATVRQAARGFGPLRRRPARGCAYGTTSACNT